MSAFICTGCHEQLRKQSHNGLFGRSKYQLFICYIDHTSQIAWLLISSYMKSNKCSFTVFVTSTSLMYLHSLVACCSFYLAPSDANLQIGRWALFYNIYYTIWQCLIRVLHPSELESEIPQLRSTLGQKCLDPSKLLLAGMDACLKLSHCYFGLEG